MSAASSPVTAGRCGLAQIHTILTRTTYIGEHKFNTRSHKEREKKPETEVAIMAVPPLIARETFDAVQARLKSRQPMVTPARISSGPTLLTGICFCAKCGGAMTLRTGKGSAGGLYRYYTCSTKTRQGKTGCEGRSIPMDRLDHLIVNHLEERLLQPERLETFLASVLDRRQERAARRSRSERQCFERAYRWPQGDPRSGESGRRARPGSGNQAVSPDMVKTFAHIARQRIRLENGGYRRDHLRALAQRVEVADKEVRITGSKSELLRTLVAASSAQSAAVGVY